MHVATQEAHPNDPPETPAETVQKRKPPGQGSRPRGRFGALLAGFALDELDFRILRELFLGDLDFLRSDRVPLDAISERLGLHRNTVSERVRRLREQGIYLPMAIGVNDPAVGLIMGMAFLDVLAAQRNDATADQVFRLGGVSNVFFYLDGWHVLLHAQTQATLDSLLEDVKLATGAAHARWDFLLREGPGMAPPGPLSLAEARLISMLYRDSRQPFDALGKDLSVTGRTAENLYRRLRQRGVIFQTPGQVTGYPGMTAAYLRAELRGSPAEQERARGAILKLVPNDFVRMIGPVGPVNLYVYGRSIAELEEQAARVRELPGVDSVAFHVLVRKRANPLFHEWIEDYLLGWAARPPMAPKPLRL